MARFFKKNIVLVSFLLLYVIMIIIFKDYDFSHESIFQTIKVILRQVRNPLTSQSI